VRARRRERKTKEVKKMISINSIGGLNNEQAIFNT
jgi:hypothetical protein